MKIRKATLWRVRLRLRRPLVTAHGRLRLREGVLLRLSTESGAEGWGEAMPLEAFGGETPDESRRRLEQAASTLLGRDARELGVLLDAIEELTPNARAARAAGDMALHDLAAQASGCGIACLLRGEGKRASPSRIAVSALLPDGAPREVGRAARRAIGQGYRTLKLKIGAAALSRDLERVRAVRDNVDRDVRLRLDANRAWPALEALRAIEGFAPHRIEFIEEPLFHPEPDSLAHLRARSEIAIAADESVSDEEGADALLARAAVDLLVIKPAALGGLRAAWRIAERARAARVGVVVTSALDSTLGCAAALQLAAALPGERPAAGLATACLLADDLAPRLALRGGEIELPSRAGLGLSPSPVAVRRLAIGGPLELRA